MKAPPMSEVAWQSRVTDYATRMGWKWYHTHNSKRSPKGFPDLVFARERVVFAELKKQGEGPTEAQREWGESLLCADAEYYLWRPSDWDEVQRVLARPRTHSAANTAANAASRRTGPTP